MTRVRYARAPSAELLKVLAPGGFLAPLLRPRSVCALPLDVQFRENDHVHVYCGLTRLVDVRLSRGVVTVSADPAYSRQPCGQGLFRPWATCEPDFGVTLDRFFADVAVNPRYTRSEGAVQSAWATVRDPWCPIDREAVIGYAERAEQMRWREFAAVADAQDEVSRLAGAGPRWTAVQTQRTAAELDQLAIDGDGHLVLVELKHASSSASVYYSPLQLLQYVHEWSAVVDSIREDLGRLQMARAVLALSPPNLPELTGVIRPVIGFGEGYLAGKAKQRFEAVLEIANRHLPVGAMPIEVWGLALGSPSRLD